ncbi:MFS general substrate transporter [Tuber magnatum]|uniref:MFS general substrate transporter n=1 Tax=Tuber magnatum TaxID=42249 RepID=A0A317T1P5_9PEZI|nr:MFS general substrate transporter [Tuber magnatum]
MSCNHNHPAFLESVSEQPQPQHHLAINQSPTDLPVLSQTTSYRSNGRPLSSPPAFNPNDSGNFTNPLTAAPSRATTTYPEGGRKAWSVVLGSFCGMVASFGIMNTIGTFQAHLSEHQLREYEAGYIGWIFGMYAFISFFGGILIGPIFDCYGPKWLLVIGTVSTVASLMLSSVSQSYWQFMLSFGVLGGMGTSLIFTPSVASIGHWFLEKRGQATGVATTGGSIGGIIFPLIIQSTTPKVGFGWAVRIVGFVCLFLMVIANCLVRARLSNINGTNKNTPKGGLDVSIDLAAFKDPRFALTALGVFMIEWGIFVPLSYITSYSLLHLHLPRAFSYQLLAILNVGSVFGRWLPGLVGDKIGRFNMMIITVAFCLVTTLAVWLPSAYMRGGSVGGAKALMVVFALMYGFGSGSGVSLTPVCVGQICETREYGRRYGTCHFFASFGTLTGIPIAGQIIHSTNGQFTGLILFTAGSYIAASVFFVAARVVGAGAGLRTVY